MTVQLTDTSTGAGSIHVERSASLPAFLEFGGDPFLTGWSVLRNLHGTFEAETVRAGWIFFFLAGSIEKTSFGIDQQKTLAVVMQRLANRVKADKHNSFEIIHVQCSRFLGLFRVTVAAHARHFQEGSVLLAQ